MTYRFRACFRNFLFQVLEGSCLSKSIGTNYCNTVALGFRKQFKCGLFHNKVVRYSSISNQEVMIESIGGQRCQRLLARKQAQAEEMIKFLKIILRIQSAKAYGIVKKHPQLTSYDSLTLTANIEDLRQKGLTDARILSMPWLLTLGPDESSVKFELVRKLLRIDSFPCAAPFLQIPVSRLNKIGDLWQKELSVSRNKNQMSTLYENRVDYLATKLKCQNTEVADMMSKVPKIMLNTLSVVEEKLKILLDYGVERDDIVKDPYVFMFNASAIEKRLKLCQTEGLDTIKPWMLRCTSVAFNLYVQRINQERELRQGHKDIADFLKEKLDCQVSEVKEILLRVPSVRRASAIKLNEMIEFLYSHGFTSSQIIEAPRVLGHSVETIDDRIRELSSYGYNPHFLNVLCQTSTNYAAFIRRLMTTSKNATTTETVNR